MTTPLAQPALTRRRRIWEIDAGWHCAIVGTCLTLGALRGLAKKLDLKPESGFPIDYQLHGFFVKAAEKQTRPGKLLNKLLDRKHASAIRRIATDASVDDLEAYWAAALEAGDIPGPYWAILSHPHADKALGERMFADVHMLSHLVGASNRADVRAVRAMEEDRAELRERLGETRRRHIETVEKKDREIAELREQLRTRNATTGRPAPCAAPEPAVEKLEAQLAGQKAKLAEVKREFAARDAALAEAERSLAELREECASLETALDSDAESSTQPPCAETGVCPLDLHGRRVLYVGGRLANVHRFRALVEKWNGELLHHDGGLERSMAELASAVTRADAVVFACDCVSHDAVHQVKKLCQQQMKPYVPLRTSGLASFVTGLRSGVANDSAPPAGQAITS